MSDLMPTHQCFDDAIEFIVEELHRDAKNAANYRVAHAICLNPHTGEPYAHAWVEGLELKPECDDVVVEGFLLGGVRVWVACPRAELYRTLRPQKIVHYTVEEWHQKNVETEHYGPWDPEIRKLCDEAAGRPPRVWERAP